MSKYKNLQLYIILILSIFFQSYLNLYDKYLEYKDRRAFIGHFESLERTKNNASNNAILNYCIKPKENYYIPKQAQFIRHFLKNNPLPSFRLSPSIIGSFNRYAILEGAFPTQVSNHSKYLITTSDDDLPIDCNELVSQEGIQIVYCP